MPASERASQAEMITIERRIECQHSSGGAQNGSRAERVARSGAKHRRERNPNTAQASPQLPVERPRVAGKQTNRFRAPEAGIGGADDIMTPLWIVIISACDALSEAGI